jgi:hypothetical protein
MGYNTLTTTERKKIEREIKQRSKEIIKSQTSTNTTSSSSSSTSNGNRTTIENSNMNMKLNDDKQTRLDMFLKSIDRALPSDKYSPKTISEEIALYGSLCCQHPQLDAILFWKTYGDQMPILKTMTQRYLATPGTSVPSESAFSRSAYIGRKERSRLTAENLSFTVFLQDKLRSN